jgi:hypothetical protein
MTENDSSLAAHSSDWSEPVLYPKTPVQDSSDIRQAVAIAKFANAHPQAGEIYAGTQLSGESAREVGKVIGLKILELSRKGEDLTSAEATLVDRTLNLSARTLVYLNHEGLPIDDTERSRQVCHDVGLLAQAGKLEPAGLPRALEFVANGDEKYSLRQSPHLRARVEDAAMSTVQLLGEIIESAGGITVGRYVEGNLQALIGVMDMATPSQV